MPERWKSPASLMDVAAGRSVADHCFAHPEREGQRNLRCHYRPCPVAAARLGLAIPKDLSVVGFDDQESVAKRLDPPLTTMQLPSYEMGQWAVKALVQLMREPEATPTEIRMPCPLVERDSVAPPMETSVGARPV